MSTFNRIIFLLSTKQISGCLNNVPVSFPGIMGSSVNLFLNNLLNYKKVSPMQLVYYPMFKTIYLVDHSEYHLNLYTENALPF